MISEEKIKQIIMTGLWAFVYCFIWIILEAIIYGYITSRMIDNIMMLLFIPMIYKAMGSTGRNKDERDFKHR